MARYTRDFKHKVLKALDGGMPIGQAEKEFKVTGTTLRSWKLQSQVKMSKAPKAKETSELARLHKENQFLKLQLAEMFIQLRAQ